MGRGEGGLNYAKHGTGFEHAKRVFKDVFAVEGLDDGVTTARSASTIIGMVEGVILHVAYTERDGTHSNDLGASEQRDMSKTTTTSRQRVGRNASHDG